MAKKAKEAEEAEVFNENAIFWPDIVIFLGNLSFFSFLSSFEELLAGSGAASIVGQKS